MGPRALTSLHLPAIKHVAFLINTYYDEKLMVITLGPAEGNIGYNLT